MKKETKENPPKTYKELSTKMITVMKQTVGQTTITTGKKKKRENAEVKEKRERKKEARKEFEKACRSNATDKNRKKEEYLTAQHQLKEAIEEMHKEETNKRIQN